MLHKVENKKPYKVNHHALCKLAIAALLLQSSSPFSIQSCMITIHQKGTILESTKIPESP